MTIEEIIAHEPLFYNKNTTYEPLNGGFSNETHIVTCESMKYVVKIFFPQNKYLNLTRATELQAQSLAASMGLAPAVYSNPKEERYSVSEFLSGHLLTYEEVMDDTIIQELAKKMKQIHSITGINRNCSAFDLIDGYVNGIRQFQVLAPDGFDIILKRMEEIRNLRERDTQNNFAYCHNDLLNLNILNENGKFGIIDWEISGFGDPYMDLATLPYQMNFSKEKETLLLTSYFGYFEEEMRTALHQMRYIGMVREVVWALFYAGLNKKSANHDNDYYQSALYALDRIQKGYLSM